MVILRISIKKKVMWFDRRITKTKKEKKFTSKKETRKSYRVRERNLRDNVEKTVGGKDQQDQKSEITAEIWEQVEDYQTKRLRKNSGMNEKRGRQLSK